MHRSSPLPAPATPAPEDPPHPRLALVLGSGGVRSIAALGLMEVLEQEGIRPDLIVGCSAGALFGALIAAGHSAAEGVRIATTLWSPEVVKPRRWMAIPQMLWPRLARFDAGFGLRKDTRVMQRLDQAFGDLHIEDLALPLRVTASDVATGERAVLTRGPLVPALRASIALPFMFSSVVIDGRRLQDGFVCDPLPASAAADADAVLALGFESPMPRRINGPSRMLAQVTSGLTNSLMQARLAEARGNGMRLLSILPRLERRVGLFDTAAMPYLVEAGRRAGRAHLAAIRELLARTSDGAQPAQPTPRALRAVA